MASDLIPLIKKAALDAMDNTQLCDLRYGRVISTSPLKVKVTDQFIIPASLLVVPQHLTNYKMTVNVDWTTNDNSEPETVDSHNHGIRGTKTMTVYNALQTGDKVALLRKQGGNSYFILDRV
jgi:hypothetical protein